MTGLITGTPDESDHQPPRGVMKLRIVLFSSFLVACFSDARAQQASAPSGTMDWPGWGGPNGSFTVENAGLFRPDRLHALKIVWKKDLGPGYSAISVRGGLAVTMFSDGTFDHVIGLDAQDGTERWRHKIGPTYLGHYGSQNGPVSTPLLTEHKVVALSPRGSLFALDSDTGRKLWAVDLVADHQAFAPFWGFTSSPRKHGNLIIVQTGGSRDNAISAFDSETGKVVWSAVSDTVNYQSTSLFRVGNREHLFFYGSRYLFGLVPETGDLIWQFAHGGQSSVINLLPVEVAEGRYFVKNRGDGGLLFRLGSTNGTYAAEEVWRTRHIKGTYIYVVYHDGHLFGYNGRILTCLDAESGDRVWRSREPGDGLPIVIDGHLVIITKTGELAVAQASADEYSESARLNLFDDIVWSPVSLANGRLYARGMSEIACVDIVGDTLASSSTAVVAGIVPDSHFAHFVEEVARSDAKTQLIDRFISEQQTFPVTEGDSLVHFVYRGEEDDVALTGDLVGRRFDQPMHRVAGTDLFYFSSHLEANARITYGYILDLAETVADPLNPRSFRSLFFGRAAWFAMPQWRTPDHLEERRDGIHGRIDSIHFESDSIEGEPILEVYLPAGYDQTGPTPYPVAYVHGARHHLTLGRMDVSLDNIIDKRVRPVIVVFIPSLLGDQYSAYVGSRRDEYARIFLDEIVPLVESTYLTATREGRANMGTIYGGFMAFYATFTRPDIFGKLAIQSIYWDQTAEAETEALIVAGSTPAAQKIYLDWGKYDLRSPMEGNDLRKSSRSFARLLRSRGYSIVGGEVNDGTGWASWKNRTDRVFETLFPISD